MKKQYLMIAIAGLVFSGAFFDSQAAFAGTVDWTDWSSVTTGASGSGSGTLGSVGVTLSGAVFGVSYDANYYKVEYPINDPTNPYFDAYGGLNPTDVIRENGQGSVTINYTSVVHNPYISLVSVGTPYLGVTYNFGGAYISTSYFSSGPNRWIYNYNDPNGLNYTPTAYTSNFNSPTNPTSITGYEFSGIIQLTGDFTTLTINFNPDEEWSGFNIGVDSPVPEPATMLLLGCGLVGLGIVRNRKKA